MEVTDPCCIVVIKKVHEKIRENPILEKKERSKPDETKNWKEKKLTYEERKAKLKVRPLFMFCCKVLHESMPIAASAMVHAVYITLCRAKHRPEWYCLTAGLPVQPACHKDGFATLTFVAVVW